MISVELKTLAPRLNRHATKSFEAALGACVNRQHYEVTIEHFLVAMMEVPGTDIHDILRHYGIDASRLTKALTKHLDSLKSGNSSGRPVLSPLLREWFQDAWLIASLEAGSTIIRSGPLFAAVLGRPDRYAAGDWIDVVEEINKDDLRKNLKEITTGSVEDDAREQAAAGGPGTGAGVSALARFCTNFTARAKEGGIDPVFGRDREIRQMIDILARRRKNNPIVVGEAGVGKTAVVEGLAVLISEGLVPDVLQNVDLLGLDLGLLQAGASVKGEFENRLKNVIDEVQASPKPIVLFIDEVHTLVGAGGAAGTGDAANLLKPALARGELRTIAATTWSEYKKYFEKDPALARRFQPVKLDEPSEEDTVTMLRGLRDKYEASHKVRILDEAEVAAAKMSARYISGRQLPDKAVDLLDTAAARVKIGLSSKPAALEDVEQRIRTMEREQSAQTRDLKAGVKGDAEAAAELTDKLEAARAERATLEARWKTEQEAAQALVKLREEIEKLPPAEQDARKADVDAALARLSEVQKADPMIHVDVNPELVGHVVSDWTGIPLGKMVRDEAAQILAFDGQLKERIKGQDHAIDAIAKGMRAAKAGIGNPRAPMGIFLFVGPSGVGKTETSLGVADLLFGGERFMTTINMSEFQEKHTVSRLIGSPPGYVGYGEGGMLTEAVRQRPYSVVLLDEVEKADPEVMNLFYQVFDKGMLSDGEGREVDFKNTVIFLTSNLASDVIMGMAQGPVRPDPEELTSAIRPALNKHFKPALVARMTIVPFYPISVDAMKDIVKLKINAIGQRLAKSHRMAFDVDPAVIDQVAQRCTEVETGARNIDHILSGSLLPKISTEILTRMNEGPLPKRLKLGLDAGGEFELTFSD
jgi:type VI secretion system protein VasG